MTLERTDRETSGRVALAEVLKRLKALGTPKARASIARFGIRAKIAYGLSAPQVHRLAREIGKDHQLAQQLWRTGIHDARHLAAMVDEPARVTELQMERWARDFDSWDIVDGCCRYLFLFARPAWKKALEWTQRDEEYVKRAGFSLMAYLAIHGKQADDAKFARLLAIIQRHAVDDRNFVKKAVNWALRQIGKRNSRLNRLAIRTAKQIRRMDSRAARWVAADALRELMSPAVQRRLRRKRAKA